MAFSSLARSLRSRLHLGRVPTAVYVGIIIAVIAAVAFAASSVVSTLGAQTFEVKTAEGTNPAPSEDAAADSQTTAAEPATIFVHVVGAVQTPGLYELAEGARVAEAINAAGGFTETAATETVNLARTLNDGEQILVADTSDTTPTVAPESATAAPQASAVQGSAAAGGLVNINTADAATLQTLDGVGPATAEKIIKDREANGPFKTVDDLTRVSGIGDKKLAALRDSICV